MIFWTASRTVDCALLDSTCDRVESVMSGYLYNINLWVYALGLAVGEGNRRQKHGQDPSTCKSPPPIRQIIHLAEPASQRARSSKLEVSETSSGIFKRTGTYQFTSTKLAWPQQSVGIRNWPLIAWSTLSDVDDILCKDVTENSSYWLAVTMFVRNNLRRALRGGNAFKKLNCHGNLG